MKRDNFTSVNNVINSVFWSKLKDFEPQDNSHIFKSSKLEDMIYNDLRETVDDGLAEIEAQGAEKLDTFPSLIQDTFQALYSIKPKRADGDRDAAGWHTKDRRAKLESCRFDRRGVH